MPESLSDWLALRAPFDAHARSTSLTREVAENLPPDRPLRILDLATGTGSNIRFLTPRLPGPQDWLAVDRDAALLAQLPLGAASRCCELGALDEDLFAGRHLVTASALLDLVSPGWIERLAAACRAANAAVLFVLSYDGRSTCSPGEPEDEMVRALFNQHQRQNDKGFGVAAGPDAVANAADAFQRAGYDVRRARSDWHLPPDAREIQRRLIEGWIEASIEVEPAHARTITAWGARRLAHVAEGRSSIIVGHEDMAGFPLG